MDYNYIITFYYLLKLGIVIFQFSCSRLISEQYNHRIDSIETNPVRCQECQEQPGIVISNFRVRTIALCYLYSISCKKMQVSMLLLYMHNILYHKNKAIRMKNQAKHIF